MTRSKPDVSVDVVLLTLTSKGLSVALSKRDKGPFEGQWALPGGYVHVEGNEDVDTDASAFRVLREKANLNAPYLEQLQVFSGLDRDPRGWSISVAYYALVPEATLVEDTNLNLFAVSDLPELPFDHAKIIKSAIARVQDKAGYSSLPTHLLPELFTLTELKSTYEALMGCKLDKSAFRRKIDALDFLELVEGETKTGSHRPAQLYRRKSRLSLFDKVL